MKCHWEKTLRETKEHLSESSKYSFQRKGLQNPGRKHTWGMWAGHDTVTRVGDGGKWRPHAPLTEGLLLARPIVVIYSVMEFSLFSEMPDMKMYVCVDNESREYLITIQAKQNVCVPTQPISLYF